MAASGIFAQPSGAVPLAAAEVLAQRGLLAAGATAVCIVTGSGLKHPSEQPPRPTVRDCTREKLGDIVHEWLATASQGRVS